MIVLLPVNLRLALRSLNRNPMRSLLTMLGIIIGVAAVLTMVALGTGARAAVQDNVEGAGTNLVFVKAGNYTRGGESVGLAAGRGAAKTLVEGDAVAITESVEGLRSVSPEVAVRTFVATPGNRAFARVRGVSDSFADMYAWSFGSGRMFTAETVAAGGGEAVLGRSLAAELFGEGADAVGSTVSVRGIDYQVVGVMDGTSDDQAETLFVPWTTLQRSLGIQHLDLITIAARRAGETSRIAEEIKTLLRERHGIQGGGAPDDFTVETQAAQALTKGLYTPAAAFALANLPRLDEVTLEEMSDTLDRASDTMTALLASIAGVSLVVGGIGIMNIMLVSVTERTREIGLRMATGARGADVALQFLVEAITLSLIGGLVGLVLGLLSARFVGWTLGWPTTVSAVAMLVAVGISGAVGLLFGSYPARRASMLDPIDALRVE